MTEMDLTSLEALGHRVEALTSAVVDLAEKVLADKASAEEQRKRDKKLVDQQRKRDILMVIGFMASFSLLFVVHIYSAAQTRVVCEAGNHTNRTLQDVFNLARAANPVASPTPGMTDTELAAHLKREKERLSREEAFFTEFERRTASRAC